MTAFAGGALTDFWFPKKGGGGSACPPAPAPVRALLCAQGQESASSSFTHLKLVCDALDRAGPDPGDFATFKIPMPFASCFRTLRSKARDEKAAQAEAIAQFNLNREQRPAACRARGMKASRGCTSERRD